MCVMPVPEAGSGPAGCVRSSRVGAAEGDDGVDCRDPVHFQ